ncbi:MAG: putative Fe-S cluster assembly protein SufT [Gammaproteobacteria bacterium]|nr:putative Fe-S cluster assembly protein SufT [Gammaproteobacteria bacterium]
MLAQSIHPAIALTRDVIGLIIPAGTPFPLKSGMLVQITQALGSSFTVFCEGHLVRLYGRDADALGLPEPVVELHSDLAMPLTEQHVMKTLRGIYDPEIPVNIVDLGLIYDCRIEPLESNQLKIWIVMTLTAPACGMGPILAGDVEYLCKQLPNVADVHVDVVFDPPWTHEQMTQAAKLTLGLI